MPMALSRTLTEAIESFGSSESPSVGSDAKRIYELLYYRYVQCVSQKDLAQQLAVSVRQVRREQSRAVAVLADHLREQYGLSSAQIAAITEQKSHEPDVEEHRDELLDELKWLQQDAGEMASPAEELRAVVGLLEPLIQQANVQMEVETGGDLADILVPVSAVALRQALLSLLNWVIRWSTSGEVSIRVTQQPETAVLRIRARRPEQSAHRSAGPEPDGLHDAKRLLQFCGTTMKMEERDDNLMIEVGLPFQDAVRVLVVDDNRDTLQLVERYAFGSRYRIIPSDDPKQTLPIVEQQCPTIIVIDVMMASLDGWELLRQLREHPTTVCCPIIVCTVLAQENVAVSLGANGFLRKPISQQAFLNALDLQYATLVQSPATAPQEH